MIYYFSGTGNTEYAAKKIARSENDAALYAPDVITGRAITPLEGRNDALGFVFPTYFYGLPIIAEDLLDALELSEVHGRYIYLVMTCGQSTGNASGLFARLLAGKGCELSASFGIRMVDNYVPTFKIQDEKTIASRLEAADADIKSICESIHNRETGNHDAYRGAAASVITSMSYPIYYNGRKTKNFRVSSACTSCGKCARGCPVNAIRMTGGKPEWQTERCVFCLRCLHSCPAKAIDYGSRTKRKGRYTNPRLKPS